MIFKVFDFNMIESVDPLPDKKCGCKCIYNDDYKQGYNDGARDKS